MIKYKKSKYLTTYLEDVMALSHPCFFGQPRDAELIVDGFRFIHTGEPEYENSIREHATKVPGAIVREFYVSISKIDPSTDKVLEWHKKAGFSVWAPQ